MLNPSLAGSWIRRLHGNSVGNIHVCSDLSWSGRLFDHQDVDSAVRYVIGLDSEGARGIYLRATSIRPDAEIETGGRGSADQSASLPGLWADIDLQGPGHKHVPNRPDLPGHDPSKPILHPLPSGEAQVTEILAEAGLPKPSFWIHSGGGLYPWWMLEEPRLLTEDPAELAAVAAISANWQKMLGSVFEAHDLHYGTGVGDLARVLRIPGTVNRKVADDPRPCHPYRGAGPNGPGYGLDVLEEALCDLQPGWDEMAAQRRSHWAAARSVSAPPMPMAATPGREHRLDEDTPLNAFERATDWETLLGNVGWVVHHEGADGTVYWTRPGKERREGWSATTNNAADRDRLYCFSDAAGLPVNEPMTKGFVFAHLHHGGDMSAAALALSQRGYGSRDGGWTPPTNPGEWVHQPPVIAQPPEPQNPEFPVDCLPPVLRNMVLSVQDHIQVAPDPAAMTALASVAALVGHKYVIRHEQSGWEQPLMLHAMTVMGSGERKSPVVSQFARIFGERERVMAAQHTDRVQADIDALDRERGSETLRGNAASANRIEDRIRALEQRLENPPRLTLETDVTAEAMACALAENGGHGAVLDGEGSIVGSLMLGRYTTGQANLDIVLEGYEGGSYRVRRKGAGSIRIDRACMSYSVMTQHSQWNRLATNDHAVGKGLLARMLLASPRSRVGTRDLRTAKPMDRMAVADWRGLVGELEQLPSPTVGEDGMIDVPTLVMSPQAQELFSEYYANHDRRMTPSGDLCSPSIMEWAAKHCGRIMRIAGLLHLASGMREDTLVSEQTMLCAIQVGEWSIGEAFKLLVREADDPKVANAEQLEMIKAAIRRLAAKENFDAERGVSIREVSRSLHAPWANRDRIAEALDQLTEVGLLRSAEFLDASGRPRTRWQVSRSLLGSDVL